jgi:hypothetical protein
MILSAATFLVLFSSLSLVTNDLLSASAPGKKTYGCQTTTSISEDTSSPRRNEPMISNLALLSTLNELDVGRLTIRIGSFERFFKQTFEDFNFRSRDHQLHISMMPYRELLISTPILLLKPGDILSVLWRFFVRTPFLQISKDHPKSSLHVLPYIH